QRVQPKRFLTQTERVYGTSAEAANQGVSGSAFKAHAGQTFVAKAFHEQPAHDQRHGEARELFIHLPVERDAIVRAAAAGQGEPLAVGSPQTGEKGFRALLPHTVTPSNDTLANAVGGVRIETFHFLLADGGIP